MVIFHYFWQQFHSKTIKKSEISCYSTFTGTVAWDFWSWDSFLEYTFNFAKYSLRYMETLNTWASLSWGSNILANILNFAKMKIDPYVCLEAQYFQGINKINSRTVRGRKGIILGSVYFLLLQLNFINI